MDAASNTTGVQFQIPGTSVVVTTRCVERGVIVRDSVSPAHTGSKRKGGALQQGMGAAIQEKADSVVQSLSDHYLQKIFEPSWDSINWMEPKKVLGLFRIRARARNFSAAEMSKF